MFKALQQYWKLVLLSCVLGLILGHLFAVDEATVRGVMTVQVGRVGTVDLVVPEKEDHGGDVKVIRGTEYYGLEPGFRMLTTTEELYRYVTVLFDHRRGRRELLPPPFISELNNYEGRILEIVVRAESEDQARNFLSSIEVSILQQHQEYFESTVRPLVDLRRRLSEWFDKLEPRNLGSANQSEEAVSDFSETDSVVRVTELLYKLDRALAKPNTHPTYRIGELKFEKISNQKNVLYLIGGLMIGLLGSIFLVAVIQLIRPYHKI